MSNISLQAWKDNENNKTRSPCGIDDPKADLFRLQYPNNVCGDTIDFKNKLTAEHTERAMHRVFKAGKQKAKQELKGWIGGANFT